MKINNDLKYMSAKGIVLFAILSALITGFAVWCYSLSTTGSLSFLDFCGWYGTTFHSFSVDDIIIAWLLFIIVPVACYGELFFLIFLTVKEAKNFESALNLKSVEFLQGKVYFNFNRPQYDFACGYNDINKIEMDLKTVMVHTKNGSYPVLSRITLNFTVLNNKNFSLTSNNTCYMRKIYNIIDCGKAVHDFSYKFSGVGKINDIDEKIRDYMTTGCKQILATQAENTCKWLSILFFLIGIFFLFSFRDIFNGKDVGELGFVVYPTFVFFLVSFIFDIMLLTDKWNENRYKRF